MFEVDRIRKINGLIVGGGGGDGLGGLLVVCPSAHQLAADSNLSPAQHRTQHSGVGNTLGALHVIMGCYPSNM